MFWHEMNNHEIPQESKLISKTFYLQSFYLLVTSLIFRNSV
jgi:hypothetical protein